MISIQNVIFNKDEVWDDMLFQYIINNIKELDKTIQVIELPETDKLEDI